MKKYFGSPLVFRLCVLLLSLNGLGIRAHAAAAASVSAPQIKYEKYTLKNGLEVILSEDHRLPLVAVDLCITSVPLTSEPDARVSPTYSST